jgi:hypothetical protein
MKLFSTALICALLACGALNADAQWRTINSPVANSIDVLRNINNTLYAGTRGNGLFVYRNFSWSALNNSSFRHTELKNH